VIDVSNEANNKFIVVKFGGAVSGIYNVIVTSKSLGNFGSTGITLEAVGKVTDY